MKPVLSVITIVYNNAEAIERTMRSVIVQDYPSIEYIVIDGHSTDGTVEIIQKYLSHIDYFISEKDQGIYDAMNKGLAVATGEYVLFMNSGDEIYDAETVSQVFASARDSDIYYGETEMYNEKWESLGQRRHRIPEAFTWKSFKYGMNVSHQAIYIKRSLTAPYDLSFNYSADIDWIIRAAKKATSITNTRRYVAKYLVGGVSKQKHWASLKERFRIFNRYYGWLPNLFHHVVIACRLVWYYIRHGRTND